MSQPKIHSWPIVACTYFPGGGGTRAGRVVLVDRGANVQPGRWVSSVQYRSRKWDSEWSHGHYFDDRNQAFAHFADASRRELDGWRQ